MAWFVAIVCLAAPAGVALVEVPFLTAVAGLQQENLLVNTISWWAGDATGIAMTAPFLLGALSRFGRIWDHPPTEEVAIAALPSRKELPMFAAQMAVMVAALLAAYTFWLPGTLEYSYFAFVPLMWIALRDGFVRDPGAIRLPHRAGLRAAPGLSLRQAAARRRVVPARGSDARTPIANRLCEASIRRTCGRRRRGRRGPSWSLRSPLPGRR